MSAVECGNCVRPVQDGAAICTTCSTVLAEALLGVPALLEDLHATYSKQDRLSSGNGRRGKLAEAPLPVRFDVRRVIDALGNEVTTWARDLVETHRFEVPKLIRRSAHNGKRGVVFPTSSPTVDAYCYAATWLADHVGYLRQHIAALEAHKGITGAIAAAELAMDRPEPQLYVGACELCSAGLYAPRDASGTQCERCGAYVADLSDRWDMALRRLRGYPATASVIAGWVGEVSGVLVSRKLVNKWHERGQIRQVDLDPKTRDPRFRIGEVLDRAAKSKPRKAG